MNNVLYLIAVLLVLLWALGFFAFNVGVTIHFLLVLAVMAVLLRIIKGTKTN